MHTHAHVHNIRVIESVTTGTVWIAYENECNMPRTITSPAEYVTFCNEQA